MNAKGGPLDWEPLLYACYSRMDGARTDWSTLEVARLLLAHGADPNAGFLWGANYVFTALTGAFGEGEDNMNQLPHPHCLRAGDAAARRRRGSKRRADALQPPFQARTTTT